MSVLQIMPPPEALLDAVRGLAREQLGADDLTGPKLAAAVQRVSETYRRQRDSPLDLQADRAALCARLKFFLPRDWPKIALPLAELASVGAFPMAPALRILDLGAGLGATGLGAAVFAWTQPGIERVQIDAVDCDASALRIAGKLAERVASWQGRPLEFVQHCARLEPGATLGLSPPYQLIVLGFVLNELWQEHEQEHEQEQEQERADAVAHHAAWLARLSELLSDDGALVVLEPALRVSSRALQQVRGVLAGAAGPPFVFAPCLHRAACPLLERERDWCHEQLPLELPAEPAAIARAAGLRTEALTFSYLTLHRSQRSLAELGAGAKLVRAVSSALRSKGKLEILVCGDGPTQRLRLLERHTSAENRALAEAGRGSIAQLPGIDGDEPAVRRIEAEDAVALLQSIR